MSTRLVDSEYITGYDENDNPIYDKLPASNKLLIIKNKIDTNPDSLGYISDNILLKTVKVHLLEDKNINSINSIDLVTKKKYDDVTRYTDYDKYMSLYITKKVGISLNITYDDFINKPIIEIDNIIAYLDRLLQKDDNPVSANELEKELSKLKGVM